MRRFAYALAAVLTAAPAFAQPAPPAQPPHGFLFGTWTGGLFPVPAGVTPQACFSQPVVIFTRDLAMRATLTEQVLTQREIETVRVVPGGVEFRFTAGFSAPALLGGRPTPLTGFGCEATTLLHVQRLAENQIAFPGCPEFPNPLVRCQTR